MGVCFNDHCIETKVERASPSGRLWHNREHWKSWHACQARIMALDAKSEWEIKVNSNNETYSPITRNSKPKVSIGETEQMPTCRRKVQIPDNVYQTIDN